MHVIECGDGGPRAAGIVNGCLIGTSVNSRLSVNDDCPQTIGLYMYITG